MSLWMYSTHRSTGDVDICVHLLPPDGLLGGQEELPVGGGQFHDVSHALSHDLVTGYLQPQSFNMVYSAPKTHASLGTKSTNQAIHTEPPSARFHHSWPRSLMSSSRLHRGLLPSSKHPAAPRQSLSVAWCKLNLCSFRTRS